MQHVKKISTLLIGLTILAFGAGILITANLGSDAVTVLNQGVSFSLNVEIGYGIFITNAVLFIVVLIFNRKKINIGTIISTILMGPLVNLAVFVLPEAFSNVFIINLMFSVLGIVIASIGLTVYIYSNVGLGPMEGFVDLVSQKINLKFGYTKVIMDLIFFVVGYLLGGVFHVASILSILMIGPLINLFLPLLKRTNFITEKEIEITSIPEDIEIIE